MLKNNKRQFWFKFLLLFLLISNLFWVSGVVVDFKYSPFKEIRNVGLSTKRVIKKLVRGSGDNRNLSQEVSENNIIESSVLPLSKQSFSLEEYNLDFSSAVLYPFEDKVLLSDALGKNLIFDGAQISVDRLFKLPLTLKKQKKATFTINEKGYEEIDLIKNTLNNHLDKSEVLPLFSFVPPVGITSITQLSGFHQRWDGDLLIATSSMQSLYRLKLVEDRVVFSEPIWIGNPIQDIVQVEDNIILLTQDSQLISISVDEVLLAKNVKGNDMLGALLPQCASCHQFTATTPLSMAPSLKNIFGKKIGADPLFTRYSFPLKQYEGIWDKKNLRKYLKNPTELIPGTAMPAMNLSDDEIEEIIALLGNPLRK